MLLPNPLPPSAPASLADTKYPYASLRKSLRLLIEEPDPSEELENDISYVYSGYAPISVRLVQCVAQKGGVLSNPATEKEKKGGDGSSSRKAAASTMVQAHPIVGWKGFEDVMASLPGETVDIVQRAPGTQDGSALPPVSLSKSVDNPRTPLSLTCLGSVLPRERQTTTVVFFLGGCTYTEIAALRWVGRQNKGWRANSFVSVSLALTEGPLQIGRKFLIATTGIISGNSMVDSIVGTASATSKEVGL